MFGEILWTEDSEAHIARHDVTPLEVERALYSRPRLVTSGREGTREVLGTTDANRYLFILVTEAADGRDFRHHRAETCRTDHGPGKGTARDMTDNERRLFREKGC